MSAGFAKGPWSVFVSGYAGDWPGVEAPGPRTIVVFGDSDVDDDGGIRGADKSEALANAHLIAAAPDMYEALAEAERMFRWYGDGHAAKPDPAKAARNYEMADRLATTLAKARGEA